MLKMMAQEKQEAKISSTSTASVTGVEALNRLKIPGADDAAASPGAAAKAGRKKFVNKLSKFPY
ncbi:MAG TPA: hypothetical protein VFQ91_18540 [Bryobacteraceae bacterium]|nr:hypothetical protein [Bryobacteraceae bacterium]